VVEVDEDTSFFFLLATFLLLQGHQKGASKMVVDSLGIIDCSWTIEKRRKKKSMLDFDLMKGVVAGCCLAGGRVVVVVCIYTMNTKMERLDEQIMAIRCQFNMHCPGLLLLLARNDGGRAILWFSFVFLGVLYIDLIVFLVLTYKSYSV